METHQSLTDVALHNLQLPTSQTHHRTLLHKIPFAISNRLVRSSQYTNQALSLSVWLFKAGFILAEVCLLKYIPSLPLPDSRHYSCQLSRPSLILLIVVFIGSPGLFFPLLLFSIINSLLITHFSLTIFRSCYFCYFCTIHTHTLYKQMDFRGIVHLKMKTLSVFTHPNVVPTSYNFFSPLNKKGEILNNVMVALFHTTTRNETGV